MADVCPACGARSVEAGLKPEHPMNPYWREYRRGEYRGLRGDPPREAGSAYLSAYARGALRRAERLREAEAASGSSDEQSAT